MSNQEHIGRLNAKIEIVKIRKRCGYIVAIAIIVAMAFLAAMWIDCQMMRQIVWQQEDCLNQLMELRNEMDKLMEQEDERVGAEVTSLGEFEITHYCTCNLCCGIYASGYTATGAKATPGRTVAADPEVIPYGTTIIIDGKEYVVEDCGGAVKGNHIDILMASHSEAVSAGRYHAEVIVKRG